MKKGQLIVGVISCLIASMSWGAMFPVANHALEYINPFYFSIIRYGAVSIVLIVLLWMKEGKEAFHLEGKVIYTMGGQSFPNWFTLRYSTLTCVFGTFVTGIITIILTMLGHVSAPSMGTISYIKYDLVFMAILPE